MPRAWPSFSVALASLLTKVASTAASSGRELLDHLGEPVVDRHQPLGERDLVAGRDRAAGDDRSAGCPRPRSGPSRCGGAPDRCRGCESGGPCAPLIDPPGAGGKASAWRLPILPNRVRGRPAARASAAGTDHVIDLPDSATFAAALADRRFFAAMAIAGAGRPGARLLRLRLGADLHAADRGDLRAAHRRGHAPADRFRLQHAVRHARGAPLHLARGACRSRSRWRSRLPLGTWLLIVLDPIVLRWFIAVAGARSASPCWRRAGAITARRRCRSPPASALFAGVGARRGADRGPAGDPLLAQRRQQRRDGARQPDGVLPVLRRRC